MLFTKISPSRWVFGAAAIVISASILKYDEKDLRGLCCVACDSKKIDSSQSLLTHEKELICAFRSQLRDDQIELDREVLKQRAQPWNSYHRVDSHPLVILFPESTADVSSIMKVCSRLNAAVVPFGGGTSLEGQTLPIANNTLIAGSPGKTCGRRPVVSLDFERMKSVLAVNEVDCDCRVQAGLGYLELNDILKERDSQLWFPLDPGPGATVGGMCACRCSGSTAVRYGSMRENVLELTVVTPTGEIVHTGTRARKSSAGYDLTRLYIGSEGTLGVITEATLKLHVRPAHSEAVLVRFPSVSAAAHLARDTLRSGVSVGRCEMLDASMVRVMNAANPKDPWLELPTLMYEVTGMSARSVQEQREAVLAAAAKHGASDVSTYTSPEQCAQVWRRRKECLWSCMAAYPDKGK